MTAMSQRDDDLEPRWRIPAEGPGRHRGIGIVGCGGIVSGAHLPAYQAAGLRVVAVHDVDRAKAEEVAARFSIATVAGSPKELIATPGTHQEIREGQAFAWNPSVEGAKAEETFVLGPDGPEILTRP